LRQKPTCSDDSSRCQANCNSDSARRHSSTDNEHTGYRPTGSENV